MNDILQTHSDLFKWYSLGAQQKKCDADRNRHKWSHGVWLQEADFWTWQIECPVSNPFARKKYVRQFFWWWWGWVSVPIHSSGKNGTQYQWGLCWASLWSMQSNLQMPYVESQWVMEEFQSLSSLVCNHGMCHLLNTSLGIDTTAKSICTWTTLYGTTAPVV
jgi:hypothetical protein